MKYEFNPLDDYRSNDIDPWAVKIGKLDITVGLSKTRKYPAATVLALAKTHLLEGSNTLKCSGMFDEFKSSRGF